MPPPPEFGDGFGEIRIIEVLQEVEAEDPAETNGHIGIAGEIEVDVQAERHGVGPVEEHGGLGTVPEAADKQGQTVGDENLLAQTHQEPPHAVTEFLHAVGAVFQLPGHVDIADDGTGDELGEEADVGAEGNEAALGRDIAPIDIDDIAQALEGVEADADGQGQPQQGDGQAGDGIDGTDEEVGIFENAHQRHRQGNTNPEPDLLPLRPTGHGQAAAVIAKNGTRHQEQVLGLAPAVEDQAENEKHQVPKPLGHNEVHQQHGRQEIKQKRNAGK